MKFLCIQYHNFWIAYHTKKVKPLESEVAEMKTHAQHVDSAHPRFPYGSYELLMVESKLHWQEYYIKKHKSFKNKYEVAEDTDS